MRRLKKSIFTRVTLLIVLVLAVIRFTNPDIAKSNEIKEEALSSDSLLSEGPEMPECSDNKGSLDTQVSTGGSLESPSSYALDYSYRHPVRGVRSYTDEFHDVQDVQFPTACKLGVQPMQTRAQVEQLRDKLVYIGASPYYIIGRQMQQSIPYLIPRAANLLQHIGRTFIDSLMVKQMPLHAIVITSALRTEEDVRTLRRTNGNVSYQSCHRFGTTIDISYRSFYDVATGRQEPVSDQMQEQLKRVLSEVLRDCHNAGMCWIIYERKQACFHITVR